MKILQLIAGFFFILPLLFFVKHKMVQATTVFILCALLFWYVPFYHQNFKNRFIPLSLFLAKVLCGYGLYFLYNTYYTDRSTGDVNKYFDDALTIYNQCKGNTNHYLKILLNIDCNTPEIRKYFMKIGHWDLTGNANLINDTRTIIRFNLLLLPFSNAVFMFHNIVANLLSFTGLCLLYQSFCLLNPKNVKVAFIAAFCIPSVFFWSSGVLKESLLFFFLGLIVYSMLGLNKAKKRFIITLMLGFLGLLISKFYLALISIPAIALYFLQPLFQFKSKKFIAFIIAAFIAIILVKGNAISSLVMSITEKQKQFVNVARGGYYFEWKNNQCIDTIYIAETNDSRLAAHGRNYTILQGCEVSYYQHLNMGDKFICKKPFEALLIQHLTPANSYIYLPVLENKAISFVKILPVAFYNVLFLPSLLHIKNVMYLMPAFENLVFIILLLMFIVKRRFEIKSNLRFAIFSISFILILVFIIGITTPILGAIVRYKIPMLPFLFYLLLMQVSAYIPFLTSDDISES